MSWEEVGGHDAVLFVPEDLTKIGFWVTWVALGTGGGWSWVDGRGLG